MKIGRLRIGRERTNETGKYVIASWAYVTGYWRWHIRWTPPTTLRSAFRRPRCGPSMASGTMLRTGRGWNMGHWGAWADLPIVGALSISGQPRMDSMKSRPKGAQP